MMLHWRGRGHLDQRMRNATLFVGHPSPSHCPLLARRPATEDPRAAGGRGGGDLNGLRLHRRRRPSVSVDGSVAPLSPAPQPERPSRLGD